MVCFELANSCPTAQVANCGAGRLWLETSSSSVLEGACSACERSRSSSFVCSRATSMELCIFPADELTALSPCGACPCPETGRETEESNDRGYTHTRRPPERNSS